MLRKLNWKWIGIGILTIVALNIVAGLITGHVRWPQLKDATNAESINLRGAQVALTAAINFLTFAIGGFIVGIKSTGRTILESGISAAIAVIIALLISGSFTIVNLVAGGLVPFLASILGGWLGAHRP